jgi:hypothetical protein
MVAITLPPPTPTPQDEDSVPDVPIAEYHIMTTENPIRSGVLTVLVRDDLGMAEFVLSFLDYLPTDELPLQVETSYDNRLWYITEWHVAVMAATFPDADELVAQCPEEDMHLLCVHGGAHNADLSNAEWSATCVYESMCELVEFVACDILDLPPLLLSDREFCTCPSHSSGSSGGSIPPER